MPELETRIGKSEALRLVVPGKMEQGLPGDKPELVTDLRGSDSLSGFLPKTYGTVYAIEAVRPPYSPAKPESAPIPKPPPQEQPTPAEPKIIAFPLVTFKFEEGADPAEIARQVDRGMQRVAQYGELVKKISEWDEKLQWGAAPVMNFHYKSGETTKNESLGVTGEFVASIKHVAASFYADELATETLTSEMAKTVREKAIAEFSIEAMAVSEAEHIIFEHAVRIADAVEVKQTEVACSTNQSTTEEGNTSNQSINPNLSNQEKEIPAEINDDRVLDEVVSVEFVRTLYNRPF